MCTEVEIMLVAFTKDSIFLPHGEPLVVSLDPSICDCLNYLAKVYFNTKLRGCGGWLDVTQPKIFDKDDFSSVVIAYGTLLNDTKTGYGEWVTISNFLETDFDSRYRTIAKEILLTSHY